MPLTLRICRSHTPSPPWPKPCWVRPAPRRSLAKSACLWYENSSSASPIRPLRPARHLRHQDLCAAVRQRDPAASCAHEGTQARTRGRAVTGGGLRGRDVTDDAFYEWLLSDHPNAGAERDWRRTAHLPGRDRPGGSRPSLGRQDQRPARRRTRCGTWPPPWDRWPTRPRPAPKPATPNRTRPASPGYAPITRPACKSLARPAPGTTLICPPDRAWRRRLPAVIRTGRPRPARSGPHAEPQARSGSADRRP